MRLGMIGLPQVGKKTLFELLTAHKPTEAELASGKTIKGVAEIKDPRFDKLVDAYKAKKNVRARIDIECLPKIEKDTIAKGTIFSDINELDAVVHVVRAFQDDAVYHVEGSVDPKRDIDFVSGELILHDLIFIEKRLEKLEKTIVKTKEETAVREKEVLVKLKAHLDKTLPLRLLDITAEDCRVISSYPFVTRKALLVVLNVSEASLKDTKDFDRIKGELAVSGIDVMQVSAKLEDEVASLESEEERREFLKELGIKEPAINVLTRLCIKTLDLISFFTVGEDEVRQWTVKRGSSAPEAAGAIHSDLEKGFIRAEVMKYSEWESAGGEDGLKSSGKLYLKGKDYIVEDGDMLNIRFNV